MVWSVLESPNTSKEQFDRDFADPHMIAPLSGGGVQIEWRGPGGLLELEIDSEGQLSYLVERPESESQEFDKATPVQVDGVLRQIFAV